MKSKASAQTDAFLFLWREFFCPICRFFGSRNFEIKFFKTEWVCKPGSVIDNHLSRLHVAMQLKHATRTHGKAAV